jgi:integrase
VTYIQRDPRWPRGPYYAAYRLADGRRAYRSTGHKDRRGAQIVADALEQAERGPKTLERLRGLFDETALRLGVGTLKRHSLSGWLEGWLEERKPHVSPQTYVAYEHAIRQFVEFVGESVTTLESVTERDITAFATHLRDKGRSPSTINKLVRLYLSQPFERARKLGLLTRNPVAATQAEKVESVAKETFTPAQVNALLSVADNDWAGVILFAWGTGARLGDVVGLKWSAIDREAGVVSFRQHKTGKVAIVGLHPDFEEWMTRQPTPINLGLAVFPSLATKPLNELSNRFKRLMTAAGITNTVLRAARGHGGRSVMALSFHSFRHTAASAVFNQAALRDIARRVTAHAEGGSLQRYLHTDLEAIRAATSLIPRLPR